MCFSLPVNLCFHEQEVGCELFFSIWILLLFLITEVFDCFVYLQGAKQHVNTGANVHTASTERCGT